MFAPAHIQHSNDILRDSARDIVGCSNSEFTCFSHDSPAHRYLSGRARCTDSDLDRLASLHSRVGHASENANDLAFLNESISTGACVAERCLWWSSLSRCCSGDEKRSCAEYLFLGVVFAIIALLFGSTFYTMVKTARRISDLSKRLVDVRQSKLWLKAQVPVHASHPYLVTRKVAGIMSLEASSEMEQALKACRRHTITILILSTIASLSLVLLATAVILAICIGPGSPMIMTSALIGVSVTGGIGLAVGAISLIIARYRGSRHIREYTHSVQQAGYLAALSERILGQCVASSLRNRHVQNCIACFLTKYPGFFSKKERDFLENLLSSSYHKNYSYCDWDRGSLGQKSTRL